jgi:predicted Zn-dependent protease
MAIYGPGGYSGTSSRSSAYKGRLLIVGVLVVISLITYANQRSTNPITGQVQHVAMTPQEEIAMGLQAAPEMARQFGGLTRDARAQERVKAVGARLVASIPKAGNIYEFNFSLLADPRTVNAFALPGGQVFITEALYSRLQTEGQLAGVLGHEIGHVVHRHSAQQMSKAGLIQGVAGAVATGAADGSGGGQLIAQGSRMAAQMLQLKYGRGDETQADEFAVEIMPGAGYDPRAMLGVMEILSKASGGDQNDSRRPPEWMSSHPDPGNRLEHLKTLISRKFPPESGGVPQGLKP